MAQAPAVPAPTTPFNVPATNEEIRGSLIVANDHLDNVEFASEAFDTIQNLVKAAQDRGLAQKYDAAEDSLKTVKGQGDDMRAVALLLTKAAQMANACADACDRLVANYEAAKKAAAEKAAKEAADKLAAEKAAAEKAAADKLAAELAAKKAAEAETLARELAAAEKVAAEKRAAAEKAAAEAQKTLVQVTNIGETKKTTEYTFGFKTGEQIVLQTAVVVDGKWTVPKLPNAKVAFYPENRCLIVSATEGTVIYTVSFDAAMNPMSGMATGTDGAGMMLEKKHSFVH